MTNVVNNTQHPNYLHYVSIHSPSVCVVDPLDRHKQVRVTCGRSLRVLNEHTQRRSKASDVAARSLAANAAATDTGR